MSASATQLWNLKITKVRKASNYDSDALGELLSPAISTRMYFDSRLRRNAFR